MSATVYQQERIAAEGTPLTRTAELEELYRELVEEAGRALEEEDLGWWVILQEGLIPKIDAEIHSVSLQVGNADGGRATVDNASSHSLPTVREGGA